MMNFTFKYVLSQFFYDTSLSKLETPESSDVNSGENVDGVPKGLPRSHSKQYLNVCKEHLQQERDLQDKHFEMVYSALEKAMKTSQRSQLKTLNGCLEKETADIMQKLQAKRHVEAS